MYNLEMFTSWIHKNIVRDKSVERFIKYNFFRPLQTNLIQSNKVALFELNISMPTYILYSLICQIKRESGINLIGYNPIKYREKLSNFSFYFFSKCRVDNGVLRPFRILKSMGVSKFIQPSKMGKFELLANQQLNQFVNGDKTSLLNLELNGIRIGDIFYDWYLRKNLLDTVDFNETNFEDDFQFFACAFYWWHEYFESNEVDSVFLSHTVYQQALLVRIGLHFGVDVFLVGNDRLYHLNSDKKWSDIEFLEYEPKSIKQFGYKIDLERSKAEIKKLRNGKGTTAAHAYASGYDGMTIANIIRNKNSINILIACHCFSDAPHAAGDMLFPDFREWLNYIGLISSKTSFNFYAKAHPHFWDSDKLHFRSFLDEYPNIHEIPSTYSNLELFRQGINVVLTIHGTIAFEAAYEGILVINASLNSPHVNYSFSLSPRSIDEYERVLFDIPRILRSWTVNPAEVEHFFDLHHLRRNQNVIFGEEGSNFYRNIGGYIEQFTNTKVFDEWIENSAVYRPEILIVKIRKFLAGSSYLFCELD
jgi:hypothetical protein